MAHGFRKFISKVFVNGEFLKILPSENFPLYGTFEVSTVIGVSLSKPTLAGSLIWSSHTQTVTRKYEQFPVRSFMLQKKTNTV